MRNGKFPILAAVCLMAAAAVAGPAVKHIVVLADESRGYCRYIDQFDPRNSFSIPVPRPVWDLQRCGKSRFRSVGGNGFTVVDIETRRIVDQFKHPALGGVCSVSDLPDGGFIASVNAKNCIKVLRFAKDRNLIATTTFTGIYNARTMTRLANGEILLSHDSGFVRGKLTDQDGEGEILQRFEIPKGRNPYHLIPDLAGKGYWGSTGYGVELVHYGLDGSIGPRWSAQQPEKLHNHFYGQVVELPEGHLMVANWTGHRPEDSRNGWQVFERDAEGNIVWFLYDPVALGSISGVCVLR